MEIRRGGRREKVDMQTECSRTKRAPPGAGRGNVKETEKRRKKREIGENEEIGVKQKAGEPYGAGLRSTEGKGRVINRGTGATEREECITQYRLKYHF